MGKHEINFNRVGFFSYPEIAFDQCLDNIFAN